MSTSLTQEEFIDNLKDIYKDSYDYSLIEYKNKTTKVTLSCSVHGEFKQLPFRLLKGISCRRCALKKVGQKKALGTEKFVERSNEVHSDKYNYSKVEYINSSTKVIIVCPKHGEFNQQAGNHIKGHGCPECKTEKGAEKQSLTLCQFIQKSNRIHKNKYDYSKVVYINNRTEVKIICPEHGEFTQVSGNHLAGYGCGKCGAEKMSKSISLTTEQFINKAKKIHNSLYNYNNVIYTNNRTKVKIKCNKHDYFFQKPNDHLDGHGCPKCGIENNITTWSPRKWTEFGKSSKNFDSFKVYVIKCWNDEEEFYKIGKTYTTLKQRFNSKRDLPYDYEAIEIIEDKCGLIVSRLEKDLQNKNKDFKYIPKLKFGGMFECFSEIKNSLK